MKTALEACVQSIMRYRPKVIFVVAIISTSVLFQACSERRELFYRSIADAIESGEVSRGWMPGFLPASTHAIRIVYNVSSPRTWCAFEFSPHDSQNFRAVLQSGVHELPARVRHIASPSTSWWPDWFSGDLIAETINRRGVTLYSLEEPSAMNQTCLLLFAIDWEKGYAFFYRTPPR